MTDSVRSMRTMLEVGLMTNLGIENKDQTGTRSKKNKINSTLPPLPEKEETRRERSRRIKKNARRGVSGEENDDLS